MSSARDAIGTRSTRNRISTKNTSNTWPTRNTVHENLNDLHNKIPRAIFESQRKIARNYKNDEYITRLRTLKID